MKIVKLLTLVVILLLLFATPALAQPPSTAPSTTPQSAGLSGAAVGAGLGAGLVLIGAGWGFGRIGAAALDGMSRQPEVAGKAQTAMIIIAALLEGATFFALLVCMLVNFRAGW
jgi:F-type H+-transporting ATPase subunit c